MQRKVLVTGGAGFIGSAVCRRLVADGASVLNLDALTYAGNLQSLAKIDNAPNYRFAKVDICDRRAVAEAFETFAPDHVIHLAAESHVDRSITGGDAFIQTNIVGTFTMLEAARAYWQALPPQRRDAFRFLHVSTDEVYGSLEDEGAFVEETRYDPSSPYSASKAAADHLVSAWARTYGLPAVISNCSNNYGPYHFPEKLIPLIILNAVHGKPLPVYGAGANVRDWLYVDDHARALDLICRAGGSAKNTMSAAATNAATSMSCAASAPSSTTFARRRARTIPSSPSSPTGPATISATRSTQPSSSASLAGGRRRRSRAGSRKRCAGISTTSGGGARSGTKSIPANVSA